MLGNFKNPYSSENHHARALEHLGHKVLKLQEGAVEGNLILSKALGSKMFVWIHTHDWKTPGRSMKEVLALLKKAKIPTVAYHLDLWFGLKRQKDMETDDYWNIEHFFTVDPKMAQYLNEKTKTKGYYLPAAISEDYVHRGKYVKKYDHDIVFIGSKSYHEEWPYRQILIDWLKQTYGPRFAHYGWDGIENVRGEDLNDLCASAKVIVGDSLCPNMNYEGYWSDRVYEILGRGGFLVHPRIKGMEKTFSNGLDLVYYDFGDFNQLETIIDFALEHPEDRGTIARDGQVVASFETYKDRWKHILSIVLPGLRYH